MQYKIPVQIENEDKIFLGLSLRQLAIILIGWGMAYALFKNLALKVGPTLAAIPAIFIGGLALLIGLFRYYEMTFLPFILALLRFLVNAKQRVWVKGVDSFSLMDIGYIVSTEKKEDKIKIEDKKKKLHKLNDAIKKL